MTTESLGFLGFGVLLVVLIVGYGHYTHRIEELEASIEAYESTVSAQRKTIDELGRLRVASEKAQASYLGMIDGLKRKLEDGRKDMSALLENEDVRKWHAAPLPDACIERLRKFQSGD